ncbi:MAG TPA: hypothetical protein VKO42_04050 [Patescibacteria group bacterium]|nr:hypothetical protein [Patescibacteria group bacterium]
MTRYRTTKKFSRNNKKSGWNQRMKIVNVFLFALIAFCGSYYVALVNDLTVKGLKVQELKNQVSCLQEENRNLNVRVTSLKSYNTVAKRTDDLDMVSIKNVKYLRAPGEFLAKK